MRWLDPLGTFATSEGVLDPLGRLFLKVKTDETPDRPETIC